MYLNDRPHLANLSALQCQACCLSAVIPTSLWFIGASQVA